MVAMRLFALAWSPLVAGCLLGSSGSSPEKLELGATCSEDGECRGDKCIDTVCTMACTPAPDECPTLWTCSKDGVLSSRSSCYPTITVEAVTGSAGQPVLIRAARSELLAANTRVHWFMTGFDDELTDTPQLTRTFSEPGSYEAHVTLLHGEQKLATGMGTVTIQ